MSDIKPPSGIGWTALLTAYCRSVESERPDRLFNDPLGAVFASGATGTSTPDAERPRLGPANGDHATGMWHFYCTYIAMRTPFYDQRLTHAVASGHRQVVLLAAGLDSRAYRLDLPDDTTVFELDQDAVLDYKQRVLDREQAQASCRRVPIAVDLREEWTGPLLAAGFDPKKATVWIVEGLLMYLSGSDCSQLLKTVGSLSAPGSRLVTEYYSRQPRVEDMRSGSKDEQEQASWALAMEQFDTGPTSSPATWLADHRWELTGLTHVAAETHRWNRPLPTELDQSDIILWLLEGEFKAT